jgi:hypothetical protein
MSSCPAASGVSIFRFGLFSAGGIKEKENAKHANERKWFCIVLFIVTETGPRLQMT